GQQNQQFPGRHPPPSHPRARRRWPRGQPWNTISCTRRFGRSGGSKSRELKASSVSAMRQANDPPGRLQFGVFEVDLRVGELTKRGLRVRLQEQPFRVLAMLLEKPGDLVTREELREKLWGRTVVDFDHGLNKAINKIREALGDSAENPRFVETVARRGYRFLADVTPVDTASDRHS